MDCTLARSVLSTNPDYIGIIKTRFLLLHSRIRNDNSQVCVRTSASYGQKKAVYGAFIFILLMFLLSGRAAAYNPDMGYCVLGIKGGYSHISGYYNDKLEGGPAIGIYFFPYTWKYFLIEIDNTFAHYRVTGTDESALISFSLGAGVVGFYPLAGFISIYAGASLKGSYYYIDARRTNREASTFKAGVSVSAGFFFPLKLGVQLRLGYSFTENDLSRNVFMAHEVFAGVSYGFGTGSRESKIEAINYSEIKNNYDRGIDTYNNGDFTQALALFKKVYELDREHSEALQYISIIEKSIKDYNEALDKIRNKDYYNAISILKEIDPRMKQATQALQDLRKELSAEIPELEKLSIKAYTDNNFELCITLLNRLLLIDPDNETARLYLPRAQKSYDAYKKFK